MKGLPAPHLILGSGSPRRAALLRQLELPFEQVVSPEEEPALQGDGPEACAVAAAGAKARAVHKLVRQRGLATNAAIVIGADTIVSLDGRLLGKPRDAGEAVDMLRALSGHTHQVYTGLALVCGDDRELRDCSVTQVRMGKISERDISGYVRSGEPLDKAGAYGIQGLGARFIEHIEGCYYNVVGLPLARLAALLVEAGYNFNTTTGDDR
jgi:septum formation protein